MSPVRPIGHPCYKPVTIPLDGDAVTIPPDKNPVTIPRNRGAS